LVVAGCVLLSSCDPYPIGALDYGVVGGPHSLFGLVFEACSRAPVTEVSLAVDASDGSTVRTVWLIRRKGGQPAANDEAATPGFEIESFVPGVVPAGFAQIIQFKPVGLHELLDFEFSVNGQNAGGITFMLSQLRPGEVTTDTRQLSLAAFHSFGKINCLSS
jgi:hypothetical protein